eukprot:780574-Prorocentrum_minimum.AAC.1
MNTKLAEGEREYTHSGHQSQKGRKYPVVARLQLLSRDCYQVVVMIGKQSTALITLQLLSRDCYRVVVMIGKQSGVPQSRAHVLDSAGCMIRALQRLRS